MIDWKKLDVNTNTRQLIENFNTNAYGSEFIDHVVGTIMNNGLLFTGKETVEGALVFPLKKVDLSGVVQSNTIFDNIRMYFREDDEVVELNEFPVDLTLFNDNLPHFLYFKKDRTYRVSDYMFGQADEVLICRFIINKDSTWNQMYIMAQRAGTPNYYAGEEFYNVEGIYLKSPGGLEISHAEGNVKRSAIEFNDPYSPDMHRDYSNAIARMPVRYTDLRNQIDYNLEPTYNLDPNHYMSYDENSKKKYNAQERIRNLFNASYNIIKYSNEAADSLKHAMTITTEQKDLKAIVQSYLNYTNSIYIMAGELASYLNNNDCFKSIDLKRLNSNITAYTNYVNTKINLSVITGAVVTAIRDCAYLVEVGKPAVCADPLKSVLNTLENEIAKLTISPGQLYDVPEGKFTIQRVLWDIYEDCFILQYGDTLFDNLDAALEMVAEVLYPVPFGRLMYIPLGLFVVKQGCTDINKDDESILISKKSTYADSSQEDFADYVARAMASKALKYIYEILDGTTAVGKADSLKHTDLATGTKTEYDDGDFFLNYDNLRNKITVVNNLTTNVHDSKKALSAYQGYVLNQNKLARDGSQPMTGTLQAQTITPVTNNTYNLGSSDLRWKNIYSKGLDVDGSATISGNTTIKGGLTVSGDLKSSAGGKYVVTGPTAFTAVRLEANSKATIESNWSKFQNGTVAVCW